MHLLTCVCVLFAVVGKGMPIKGNPFVKGDLFIKFDVEFPKKGSLSAEQLAVRVRVCWLVLMRVFLDLLLSIVLR